MAEKMQNSALFSSVITPLAISKILRKLDIDPEVEKMTQTEKAGAFRKVCGVTKADAIVAFETLGTETDISIFSFSRANTSSKARMILYGCKSNTIVYESMLKVKVNLGSTIPDEYEIEKIAGEAVAEKLIQMIEGKEPVATDGLTEVDEKENKEFDFPFLKEIFSEKDLEEKDNK
uniref:Uncharacterized protein n=1 Tax=Candidatus Kentrum sp. TUN TaxID=2126343 RepID=A0A450ZZ30_9GAMM|nr:MAG: hypothetical protein BECKTUN1418D_GA0071000_10949 [Candidatus Kentron sp. TUN]